MMTSTMTSRSNVMDKHYKCLDCNRAFEEAEADNAGLCEWEFNPACPACGGDNLEEEDNEV